MSYGITWLIEDKLLLLQGWNQITDDDIKDMDVRIGQLLDRSTSPLVHGIHDHRKTQRIPSAKQLMQIKAGRHPRVGWLIFLGLDNKLLKFFVSATGQALHLRLRFMDSMEEALTFLQEMDSTLPDLKSLDLTAADTRIRESAANIDKAS